MTNEEALIKQNKWLTCSAINALGPFIKINDNYEPSERSYAIAAGHLRDLIRDVSAKLTDEQKNCPYCHKFENSNYHLVTGAGLPLQLEIEDEDRPFELQSLFFGIDHPLYIKYLGDKFATRLFLDDGQRYDMPISYCPKCGRKLND